MRAFADLQTKSVETQNAFPKIQVLEDNAAALLSAAVERAKKKGLPDAPQNSS